MHNAPSLCGYMLITGDNNAEITFRREALSLRFEMQCLGEFSCFLGLEVRESDVFFVSQKSYGTSLLDCFRMEVATLMEPFLKLTKDGK